MARERLTCIVCGRKFPRGQGIVLNIGGVELDFHSKRCALKFLTSLLEHLDQDQLRRAVNETVREFEEARRLREEEKRKTII